MTICGSKNETKFVQDKVDILKRTVDFVRSNDAIFIITIIDAMRQFLCAKSRSAMTLGMHFCKNPVFAYLGSSNYVEDVL